MGCVLHRHITEYLQPSPFFLIIDVRILIYSAITVEDSPDLSQLSLLPPPVVIASLLINGRDAHRPLIRAMILSNALKLSLLFSARLGSGPVDFNATDKAQSNTLSLCEKPANHATLQFLRFRSSRQCE